MRAKEPEFIVICGSTRFIEEMKKVEQILTWRGNLVFAPTKFDLKTPDQLWSDPEELKAGAERLASVHYAAIHRCDWVLVFGNYAGESVRKEIQFAKDIEVPVWFTDSQLAAEFDGRVHTV